uniref:Membrane-spanning 4-domains subfamily A member 18 n=1 Tax=Fundulus heteroclitus TaxID=8078 RepID=A0A3Q2Q8B1_FUNHE
MSVTMAKQDGVTVFTIQSNPQSPWPPVCQILKSLCYNPLCCSVSQHLRKTQGTSLSVLGAMQIMTGLLTMGFGGILRASEATYWEPNFTEFPYWLGVLFITFGSMCLLSERFPSLCLVGLTVMLNLAGVAFAITAIVLFSIQISLEFWWYCSIYSSSYSNYDRTTAAPLEREFSRQMCLEGKYVAQVIHKGINVVLIILSILELCVVISSAIIGIKTLRNFRKEENTRTDDPECNKLMLGENLSACS